MELTVTPRDLQPSRKEAFFIIRVLMFAASSKIKDDRRLLTFARREGPDADNAHAVEEATRAQVNKTFPGHIISDVTVTSVTKSTWETARLMQSGKQQASFSQTVVPDPSREYRIVPSPISPDYFRVVAPDGEESALYSRSECEEIIRLAKDGALLGNFDASAAAQTYEMRDSEEDGEQV